VNAPRVPRTRLATSAVSQVTSPVTAPTHLPREVLVVEASLAVLVDLRSATSAQRSATLPVTAPRLVDMVAVDMASARREDMVVVAALVDAKVVRPVTPAVVMATCLVTAPKARSATTVARLAICQETARPRPAPSALATSASNPATFRLNARTKSSMMFTAIDTMRTDLRTRARSIDSTLPRRRHACNLID